MCEESRYFKNINKIKKIFLDKKSMIESKLLYGKDIMCSFLNIAPNTIIPAHSHPEEQILIVIEGEIMHTVDNLSRKLIAGDVAIQPSNVLHGGTTGKEGLKGIDIFSPIRQDFIELLKKCDFE